MWVGLSRDRVRSQRICVCAGASVKGQRAGVCAVNVQNGPGVPSCAFTLARFYVRSKGKCSWCKRLAEYCYSASNLGRFYVRSKGKCSRCKSLAEYCYSGEGFT